MRAEAWPCYRGQPNACGAANQYIYQLEKAGLLQFPDTERPKVARPRPRCRSASNVFLDPGAPARAAAEARMVAIRARVKHVDVHHQGE